MVHVFFISEDGWQGFSFWCLRVDVPMCKSQRE